MVDKTAYGIYETTYYHTNAYVQGGTTFERHYRIGPPLFSNYVVTLTKTRHIALLLYSSRGQAIVVRETLVLV